MQSLPFSSFPTIVADRIVNNSISNLNNFPRRNTCSTTIPNNFATSSPKPDFNLMKLKFGEHVKVHEDNYFQTNSPNYRGAPAIRLDMTNNSTDSCYFMSLVNGNRITRCTWIPLPMPQWIASRVEDIATAEGQPRENVINSVFAEPGDYSNISNEHANRDDSDSDCSPEYNASYDGIMNWNEYGSLPEGN